MLLKIQRYDSKQSFWLLDDVRKVSVSDSLHPSSGYGLYDINIFDVIPKKHDCTCDGVNSGCSNCRYFREIICRLNNGEEIIIGFDTIAYILNDNGKTIEKIVANYNE